MHDAAAWQALQKQKENGEASGGYYNAEALAAERRAWMAFILYVCFGRWLGRYLGNRILRDRRPPVTETVSGRYLMEDDKAA